MTKSLGFVEVLERLAIAEDENKRLRAKLADNPERQPARPDSPAPEGDPEESDDAGDEGKDIAEEAEKRRKRKQKESLADDDTSSSPSSDPREEAFHDALYWRGVRALSRAVVLAHERVTGRAEESSASDTAYERTLARAGERHGSYPDQVQATVKAIVAADRKRRGEM